MHEARRTVAWLIFDIRQNLLVRFLHYRSVFLVGTVVGATALCGCSGFKYSEPPAQKLGEPSDAERQRQADRRAQQLGEKPKPVDYSRK